MARSRTRKFQPADTTASPSSGACADLVERARRLSRKGEHRKAWLTLQEACCASSDDSRLWVLYAAQSRRMNRLDEAEKALGQALFLRERQRDEARARVLRRLLEDLRSERRAA